MCSLPFLVAPAAADESMRFKPAAFNSFVSLIRYVTSRNVCDNVMYSLLVELTATSFWTL